MVVKGVEGELHRLADNCDVASHFVVHPLVTEDLKSPHLKELKRNEETILQKVQKIKTPDLGSPAC